LGASDLPRRLEAFGTGTLMDVPVTLLGKILLTKTALERLDLFVDQKVVLKTALTRKLLTAILKLA